MKVRIKIIEKKNGTKIFIPQANELLKKCPTFELSMVVAQRATKLKRHKVYFCAFFLDYDSAMAFLQEYIKQEKLAIYNSKEEAEQARMLEKAEEARVEGEKIKKVKYINVKNDYEYLGKM